MIVKNVPSVTLWYMISIPPEEPYCLIYERFIVDMIHRNITCYDFEPIDEDNND